ncbi:adenosylcobinamide-phosphate synthase CbiB [Halobellus rubicundus]|uniref:Probable cobalamin biosynthesis protein CobD n=1 Tax=Halobellus rubicundus TaxID=2996466 RepID=A0ABD5MA53_9EURY
MPVTATVAVALAAGLDAAVGEPPARIHPVALLGRVVGLVDRGAEPSADAALSPRLVGALAALALPLGFAGVAVGVVAAGAAVDPWLGAALAGGVLFSTTSLRLLLASAREVIDASDADLGEARTALRALAGRDAAALDAAHVRSAAVESLAENLADGLVAPLAAFAVVAAGASALAGAGPVAGADLRALALPLAAGAAAWVKAVNTLDSMLGYRSKPVGWAPARLDDLVMWLPARTSALLIAVAAGAPSLPFRAPVRRLARRPASPNSGWPMATMAAALSVRLEKPGAYDLDPGPGTEDAALSDASDSTETGYCVEVSARLPDISTATRAVRVTRRAGLLAAALAGVVAWC